MRRSDGVEQVNCGIAKGIVAVDMEELTGRAVKAVEWHVVDVDRNRGWGPERRRQKMREGVRGACLRRDIVYSIGERKEYRP
jgi:hypothetical protein